MTWCFVYITLLSTVLVYLELNLDQLNNLKWFTAHILSFCMRVTHQFVLYLQLYNWSNVIKIHFLNTLYTYNTIFLLFTIGIKRTFLKQSYVLLLSDSSFQQNNFAMYLTIITTKVLTGTLSKFFWYPVYISVINSIETQVIF